MTCAHDLRRRQDENDLHPARVRFNRRFISGWKDRLAVDVRAVAMSFACWRDFSFLHASPNRFAVRASLGVSVPCAA